MGHSPSGCGRYGLEVRAASIDKVLQDDAPVLPGVPRDFARGVHLDGHDLADSTALDDDDEGPNPPAVTAALFAALDIGDDERITDVRAGNDVCVRYRESDKQQTRVSIGTGTGGMRNGLTDGAILRGCGSSVR